MRMLVIAALGTALASAPLGAQQEAGRRIFEGKGNCHVCHGKDAHGTPLGPDLTDAEWLNIDGTEAAIVALVTKGVAKPVKYPAPMPAMGGARLSREEVAAVAAYVAGLKRPDG